MAITLTKEWQNVANGSFVPGTGLSVTFWLDAKYSTQSQVNNTTTVQTRLNCTVNSGYGNGYNYSFSCSYAPTVSGSGLWTLSTETITSGESTITHNSDGTKTISLSANARINGIGMNVSFSGDAIIPRIDRYATLSSAQDFTDEGNPKITFTKNVASGAKVYAGIFNSAGTTAYASYRDISSSISSGEYTFNLTTAERNALRNAIPNAKTMQVQFKMYTTISGTNFDGGSITKTMSITNANPTLTSPTYSEQNAKVSALLGSSGSTVVQNASTLRVGITAMALKGASISKVVATHSGSTYTDTSSPYSFDIPIKSNSITLTATDSRTNTGTLNITKTMLAYTPVAINTFSFKRQTETSSTIILNLSATYYQQTFGSTANAPIVKWKMGDGSWTTLTSSQYTIDNTNHKLTVSNLSLGAILDYQDEATFTIYIKDKLSTAQNSGKVTIGIPTLDVGKDDVVVNDTLEVAKCVKIPKNSTAGYGVVNSSGQSIIRDWNNTNVTVDATGGNLYLGYNNTTGLNLMHDKAQVTDNGTYIATSGGIRSKLETIGGRITDANISHTYENNKAHMQLAIATSSMTSNKPSGDGYILYFTWDNSGSWDSQLFIPEETSASKPLQARIKGNGTWGAWENIYRAKSLYDNSSGTTGTVTLSESASNFAYLEIFYNGGGAWGSVRVYSPNDKTVSLRTASQETNNINNYFNCRNVKVSGTSITTSTYARSVFYSNSNISQANNSVSIHRVLGYR